MRKTTSFDRTQAELTKSLHALRIVARKIGQKYIATLEAEVARLETAVRESHPDQTANRQRLQQMKTMLHWLADLDVRPRKGQKRDLRVLDKLIHKLSKLVERW
jgi:hypothetical protein